MNIRNFLTRALRKIIPGFSALKKTAQFWDQTDTASSIDYWGNNKVIREFIQKEITGDASLSWYTKTIRERPTPFGRILTFGDGHGMGAEAFLTKRDTTEIIYLNISNGEGTRFKKKMEELDIDIPYSFIQADANSFDYASLGFFDTIIDVGAFHHFENFEYIYPQLNNQLKPDGIMYVDEYVGLSKLGFEQHVIDIINKLLTSLPEDLIACQKKVFQNDYKQLWKRSNDPSEGIRSGDLDRMLRRYFKLVEATSFGGTLLQPFFLTSQLNPCRLNIKNWHHTEIGKMESDRLVRLENKLINSGEIKKDYIYYILKKK
ncbi:MAG: class I SAM-dependent methyltransferase [Candidatus Aminicenantes bacterium]|nr:class I SAM-dependent methyltransferase [Candidatus Aminicenantes bacterium]